MTRPPAGYIAPSGDVMVPPEMARILWGHAGLSDFRVRVRGRRPDLDALLEAVRVAGERWAGADRGTVQAAPAEPVPEWLTTKQVADRTGCTSRWITELISRQRIDATWHGGQWQISRESFEHFMASRARRTA